MLWSALLLPFGPDATPPPHDALHGLATWALQFTPRVALSDDAVLMEVEASVRVSAGLFVASFRVALQAFEAALVTFRPYMADRGPPFGIPPALLRTKFVDEVPNRFAAVRNSADGLLGFFVFVCCIHKAIGESQVFARLCLQA